MGLQILPVFDRHVAIGATLSRQFGLLSNDALILALMQENGVSHIATHDSDFDRVPSIIRFGPA